MNRNKSYLERMTCSRGQEESLLGQFIDVFGKNENIETRSARRALTETLFVSVKNGSEAQVRYVLSLKNMDVLATRNNQNVLEFFCTVIGLEPKRYQDKDFAPEKEVPPERLAAYYVLNTHYKDALRQKELARQLFIENLEARPKGIVPKKLERASFLATLCCLPKASLAGLKDILCGKKYFPRKITHVQGMVRKIIARQDRKQRVL